MGSIFPVIMSLMIMEQKASSTIPPVVDVITGYLTSANHWIIIMET